MAFAFLLSFFLALVSLPEAPELAAAPRSLLVLEAVPELPVPVVPVAALGLDVAELAPVPLVPDDEVLPAPLVPEALDGLDGLGGIEVDVPLPPAMPASLPVPAPDAPVAFCERTVDDGDVELPPAPVDCAKARDDTDAITTNDSVRSWVVRVIATSFS
ncbi:hypothetical protein [Noviherbaspirillum aerium]|uniref:hypothetical protein n=1 Tax=Noviherbaspirillum aerium TaxID=2588497 RepID=UPI00124F3B11|nr:hypothetical protein [Noviherbaspirillum aerium]